MHLYRWCSPGEHRFPIHLYIKPAPLQRPPIKKEMDGIFTLRVPLQFQLKHYGNVFNDVYMLLQCPIFSAKVAHFDGKVGAKMEIFKVALFLAASLVMLPY